MQIIIICSVLTKDYIEEDYTRDLDTGLDILIPCL